MQKTQIQAFLFALALTSAYSTQTWAQDVIVDFQKEAQFTGKDETIAKGDNITFTFVGDVNKKGASIYGNGSWASIYYLTVSAPRNIAVIEYEVEISRNKTDNVAVSVGEMNQLMDHTWVWKGSAKSITFTGGATTTNFCITRMRFWYDEKDYNHDTAIWESQQGGDDGEDSPFKADIDLTNDNTDYTTKDRVYASVNIVPTDGHGVPMAVVSDRKFEQTLQPYLEWKTQQGYEVQELYTDEVPTGLERQQWALALRERLMAMDPRPAYVLLVGDSDEVPVFYGVSGDHASDFYYGEFTDDHFADAYVGRFCATTTDELQWQLDKTRHMAMLPPSEGEWLKHSITINDVTTDIAAMNDAVSLSKNYFKNFEGNVTEEMKASWGSTINTTINNGCSFVNYFGHGSINSWNNSYLTTTAGQLTNKNRYPVVLSMTCQTGTFDFSCLAESFMRKQEAGAVAVLAASRNSFATDNNSIFRGSEAGKKAASLGMFRSLFPCVGSELSQRARTIGQAMDIGMIAVARTFSADYNIASEMYNLFGDPTYQPYITTPKANKLSASSYNITAGRNVIVTTVPDAMVCLSQGRTVIAAAMADSQGKTTLHVPATTTLSGECTLYTSAPGYNDLSRKVTLTAGNGTDELLADEAKAAPAVTHTDVISLATVGDAVQNTWIGQQSFNGSSSKAQYAIVATTEKQEYSSGRQRWLNSDAPFAGIFLRNKYNICSLITTRTGGKARTVSVDWLYPTGLAEVIGVYGSTTAYSSTEQAWNGGQGKKLGELIKGVNNSLTIDGDYEYLLFRAEDSREYGDEEQFNVFIKSLSIGWEADVPQCATPQIAFSDGEFQFKCATSGATYSYGIAPSTTDSSSFILTVCATAPGYAPSEKATLVIDENELVKVGGDIDENGTINITDITKLIKNLNNK